MKFLIALLLAANVIFAAANLALGNFVIGGLNIAAAILLILNLLEME